MAQTPRQEDVDEPMPSQGDEEEPSENVEPVDPSSRRRRLTTLKTRKETKPTEVKANAPPKMKRPSPGDDQLLHRPRVARTKDGRIEL
eukprot:1122267-Alexandrium_andersonii.AAC.1